MQQRENDRLPERPRTAVWDTVEGGDQASHDSFAAHLSMLQQAAERYFLYAPPPPKSSHAGAGFSTTRSVSDLHSTSDRFSSAAARSTEASLSDIGYRSTATMYTHSEFSQSDTSRSKSSIARMNTQVRTSIDFDRQNSAFSTHSDSTPLRIPLPSIVSNHFGADTSAPPTSGESDKRSGGHPFATAPPPLEHFSGRPVPPESAPITVQMATFPAPSFQPPTLLEEEINYHDNGLEFSFVSASKRRKLHAFTFDDPAAVSGRQQFSDNPRSRAHPRTLTSHTSSSNRSSQRNMFPLASSLRPSRSNPSLRSLTARTRGTAITPSMSSTSHMSPTSRSGLVAGALSTRSTLPRTRGAAIPSPSSHAFQNTSLVHTSPTPVIVRTPNTRSHMRGVAAPSSSRRVHQSTSPKAAMPRRVRSAATLPRPPSADVGSPTAAFSLSHLRASATLPRSFSPSQVRPSESESAAGDIPRVVPSASKPTSDSKTTAT